MVKTKYDVLHIDDQKDHHDTIVNAAKRHGINLIYQSNLDDGYEELLKSARFRAVIFDGHAQISKGSGVDYTFVSEARVKMEALAAEKGRIVPYLFYTAYKTKLDEMVPPEIQVIDKKDETEILFKALTKLIENAADYQVRKEHEKVFTLFEKGYLSNRVEENLLKILMTYKSSAEIYNNMRAARVILEDALKTMAKKKVVFTREFVDNVGDRYHFNDYHHFLKGDHREIRNNKETYPAFISLCAFNIHKIASEYGNHSPNGKYEISKYTVRTVVYSLLDFLLWFQGMMGKYSER